METKICTVCKRELPLNAFNKCSKNKNGLKELCKECSHYKGKIYRQNNKEKILKKHAEYRRQNRGTLLIKNKEYHATHREQEKAYRLKYKQEVTRPYCKKGQETQIENYEKAKVDNFVGWARHHRLETHNSDGERRLVDLTVDELKALDMYYDRPPEELIWLRNSEHAKLHCKGKK